MQSPGVPSEEITNSNVSATELPEQSGKRVCKVRHVEMDETKREESSLKESKDKSIDSSCQSASSGLDRGSLQQQEETPCQSTESNENCNKVTESSQQSEPVKLSNQAESTKIFTSRETDDSDDDRILVPSSRFRSAPGHRPSSYKAACC
ncbi:DDB1- and CUL4-associated factor 6-like isoform X2 [Rhincodon typus]|uniref:DDB1- and CUL4-associated factor 6-like isoform X2 n=1 Tax=Rhincodon typus TaxID=259920 RepID=UPI0020306CF4|nr:DDB1- and CUL4-associated factor 6-like isoform X2 [Rhincodon typus]